MTLCEDDLSILKHQFSFTPIKEIVSKSNNSVVDVIGIVVFVDPSSTIRMGGTEVLRQSIKILDMSTSTIDVTLWGPTTQKEGTKLQHMYHSEQAIVLAIKNGCVSDYNGKVISTFVTKHLSIDPNIEEAKQLKTWYAQNGANIVPSSTKFDDMPPIITRMTIANI